MKRLTRWTIAVVAATALLASPIAVSAQQTSPEPAQKPTPTEPAQPTPTEPAQQPTPPSSPGQATSRDAAPQVDAEAAKRHLTAARDALSQLTQLPAAAQLAGDARAQISQLITNFNELITTNVEWRASYAKVAGNLTTLIGDQRADESPATPAAGTPGAVGTSGTVAIDPTLKAKLVEFRTHLLQFEKAAGGGASSSQSPAASSADAPSSATPATPPSNTTAAGSTSAPPSSVTSTAAAAPPTSSEATSEAVGTSGRASSAPTPTGTSGRAAAREPDPEPQTRPEAPTAQTEAQSTASQQPGNPEALRHIEAIEAILSSRAADRPTGTSGSASGERASTIDRDQAERIRTHLAALRSLLDK